MQVKGKVCVVTGGASGIGEATARAFAEAGARAVVVADLKSSGDRLNAVAKDIGGLAVPTDVAQESEIKALIAATEAKYGPIDIFFSNAGLSRKGQQDASERVTLSLGAAAWRSGDSMQALFDRADRALYAAKAAGRDRVAVEN